MPTIKGPLKVNMNGKTIGDLIKEKAQDLKNELPFKATGWKSQKNSQMVPGGCKLDTKQEPKDCDCEPIVAQAAKPRGRPRKKKGG